MANAKTLFIPAILSLNALCAHASSIDSLLFRSAEALERQELSVAKKVAFQALQIARKSESDSATAHASYRLANAFQASENYQVAQEYYAQAIELADVLGDSHLLAKALLTQGSLQMNLKRHTEATLSMEHAERITLSLGDSALLMHIKLHTGNLAFSVQEFQAALLHYKAAHRLCLEHGNPPLRAGLLQNISETEARLERWEQAERHARDAIALRTELNNEYYLNKSYENLFFQFIARQEIQKLMECQQEYYEVLDQSGLAMTDEMTEQMSHISAEMIAWDRQRDAQILWLLAFMATSLLAVVGSLLWVRTNRRKETRNREQLALRIRQMEMAGERPSVQKRVDILKDHSNPMLVTCYLLLGVGYSQAELGRLVGRDRATVHRWIHEIARMLEIDDPRLDARIHLGTE